MAIVIIDYGAGNAVNVQNALRKLGIQPIISSSSAVWKKADALIFPGVGSFGAAMKNLGKNASELQQLIAETRLPFIGICLGMQLLLEESEESSGISGLGIVKGKAKRFAGSLPVPQIGWNKVSVEKTNCPLFDGLKEPYAYFVHSYYCEPSDKSIISATTEYGLKFASAFWKDNVYATQFHPEKSGKDGLQILENFIREVRK